MLAAGTQLGPYQILAPLGAGGMGEVYRARDTRLDREVAVKVLPGHLANDPDRLARFEREAKAVAALSHPNILAIYDCGKEHGFSFAVTELLEGETLRERLTHAPLPWRKAVEIGVALADGLAAAHAKGIVHRDLKPENIFLTADGRVKILDFGLARVELSAPPDAPTGLYQPAPTDPGTVLGTVGYMAPEQVRGQVVDARSDLFALGCVLYELVTSRPAFRRATAADSQAAILREEPPALTAPGLSIPVELEKLILLCLEKNPELRFQSARDLGFALQVLHRGPGLGGSDPWAVPRPARPTRRGKAIDSLAILPLVNASADPAMDYLCDGITDSIIDNLSQLPKLRVMARSTVFRFKGRDADPCAVGRELQVRAVLTGRVMQRGDRLRIRVELVDAADGALLWGEQYNRPRAEIFVIEEEIARAISARLRLQLTGKEKKRLGKRPTENTEAYELYLRGCHCSAEWTPGSFQRAIDHFTQAIKLDPGYALAYAGLADTYFRAATHWLPPGQAIPQARAAALRAVELDDQLSEAHASLGVAIQYHDWDWPGAEAEFRRALELKPNSAVARYWYGMFLGEMGRLDEAVAQLRHALDHDPLALHINTFLGVFLGTAGRYPEAVAQLRKTIAMDPAFYLAHTFLGWTLLRMGRLSEALASLTRATELVTDDPTQIAELGFAEGLAGERDRARDRLRKLEELARHRYVSPYERASVYSGLGEKEEAFAWLEKAYAERSVWMVRLKVAFTMEPLRTDPRFAALVRRVGLPP
jgi:serine/threonine-protein kinase